MPENHPQRATVEDIVPLSKGGKNNRSNWALACSTCNQRKGAEEHPLSKRVQMTNKRLGQSDSAWHRARRAVNEARDEARIAEVERLARLARQPFTLYPPIPGVPDEAFR